MPRAKKVLKSRASSALKIGDVVVYKDAPWRRMTIVGLTESTYEVEYWVHGTSRQSCFARESSLLHAPSGRRRT